MDKILDKSKSLNEGAILLLVFGVGTCYWGILTLSAFFDNNKKVLYIG